MHTVCRKLSKPCLLPQRKLLLSLMFSYRLYPSHKITKIYCQKSAIQTNTLQEFPLKHFSVIWESVKSHVTFWTRNSVTETNFVNISETLSHLAVFFPSVLQIDFQQGNLISTKTGTSVRVKSVKSICQYLQSWDLSFFPTCSYYFVSKTNLHVLQQWRIM